MKTVAKNWKSIRQVFWLGPLLLVAGFSARIVAGTWGSVPLALAIAGIVISLLWLVFQNYFGQVSTVSWLGRRSTQAGTNALVSTLAVLVILGLLNFLAVRHSQRFDLTENQLFTLSPQSQQVVRNLKQPVKVWVFDAQQNPQDRELLENFRRQGTQFSFEFIDPNAQRLLAEQFGVKNFGDVFLELQPGKRRKLLQTLNEQQRLSEDKLTNGLEQLISDRQTKVYFLQGHGERPLEQGQGAISQAVKSLTDKNFVSQPLTLAEQAEIPADAAVVVVAGPQRSLFEGEVKVLKDYLNRGGNLLVMIDPKTDPKLNSLLQDWGVTLDNRIVVDASGQGRLVGLPPTAPLITQYGEHPITKDFSNGISFFYPFARPLDITPVKDVQQTPLLFSNPQSWAESDANSQDLKFDPQSDRQGPLLLGAALSRPVTLPGNKTEANKPEANKKAEARLVVLGNSNFAANGLFEQQLNGDIFLNSVSWLSQQEGQTLSIRPKESKNRNLTLTPQQANLVALAALLILPLLGFGTAAAIWWQRR